MSKINVSTETLRGVNEEIEAITEALIQNKTELKNLMEQINNKIASDEVKPRLVAYGDILEEVCKNINQTLASLKEYLGNQIEKYERIDAESREKLASEARILEQLETEDGGGTATAAGAAAVAGGAALAGGGNEDTADQAQTTGDTNGESAQANNSSDSDSKTIEITDIDTTGAKSHSVTGLSICTDGAKKSYRSKYHQYQTSHTIDGKYLEADKIPYVVVPGGQGYQKGSLAIVTDSTTGKQVYAIVGDVGRPEKGYGEVSLKTAWDLGYTNADGSQNGGATGNFTITILPNSKQDWSYNNLYNEIQAAGAKINS